MDDRLRAELIGAVVQLATAIEQILALTERLLGMRVPVGLSAQELTDARSQAALWREQLDLLKVRVASLTVPPPDRPQFVGRPTVWLWGPSSSAN